MSLTTHTLTLTTYDPDIPSSPTPLDGEWRVWLEVSVPGGHGHVLALNDVGAGIGGQSTKQTVNGVATFHLPDTEQAGFEPSGAYFKAYFSSTNRSVRFPSEPFLMDGNKTLADIIVVSREPVTPSILAEAIAAAAAAEAAALRAEAAADESEASAEDAEAALAGVPAAVAATLVDPASAATAALVAKINAAFAAFVAGAPGALDTWLEVVASIQNDETAAGTLTTLVGNIRNFTDATLVAALNAAFVAQGGAADGLWFGTQAEYDALGTYDADTLYITDDGMAGFAYQPINAQLSAIAALTTTSYGRAFLALADAAAGRTALGLGTAATTATTAYDAAGVGAAAASAAQAAAIAASLQRASNLSDLASASTARTNLGLGSVDNYSIAALLEWLTTGEAIYSRQFMNATNVVATLGTVRLTYFTARTSQTITKLRTLSGTTAAATVTLARLGLYTVAGNGDLTLVASTTNDTTLWTAASTSYEKALSSSYTVVAGTRYALGTIVTGTTANTFAGYSGDGTEFTSQPPRLAGRVASQTDLPASVLNASISTSGSRIYGVLVP